VYIERLKEALIQMIVEVGAYPGAFRGLADDRLLQYSSRNEEFRKIANLPEQGRIFKTRGYFALLISNVERIARWRAKSAGNRSQAEAETTAWHCQKPWVRI
jgi:hypothetical protein